MSDTGRKDLPDKVHDAVVPDSTKSTSQKVSDSITGSTDNAAAHAQPDSTKSTTQKIADAATSSTSTTTSTSGSAHPDDGSLLDKAKHAVGMDKSTKH